MILTNLIKRASLLKPDALATIDGSRKRTWKECHERISKLAGALIELDVKPGDRVAILALNSDHYYEYFFAVMWIGAIAVPMNTRWSVAENLYSIEDSTPTILFVDDAFVEHAYQLIKRTDIIKNVIYFGDNNTPESMLCMESLISTASPAVDVENGYDDLAAIFYTGGTTGFPKGVMLSHQNIWTNAIITIVFCAENGITKHGPYLHIAPMFHVGDFQFVISTTMHMRPHVFVSSFSPKLLLKTIADNKVEETMLVVSMIKMLIEHPDFDKYDLTSFKYLAYGASSITVQALKNAISKLPNVSFIQGFGQTEMSGCITLMPPEDHDPEGPNVHRLEATGRPPVGISVKIVDSSSEEIPNDEIGSILVRGPNAMMGYWNKPEQTAETLVDGWVLTGDVGYVDKDGYLYIVDRLKDMIVTGGENVFSAEVENAVASHAAVNSVAVIGIPSKKWGETILAIVVLNEGCTITEEELITHCKTLIAGYKCPTVIEFRDEHLPLSGVGKVLKTELRKPYWKDTDMSDN